MEFSVVQIGIVVLTLSMIGVIGFLTLTNIKSYLVQLETADPKAWKELGRPKEGVLAPEYRIAFLSFLIARARTNSGDAQLNQVGTSILVFLFVVVTDVVFIAVILGFGLFQ